MSTTRRYALELHLGVDPPDRRWAVFVRRLDDGAPLATDGTLGTAGHFEPAFHLHELAELPHPCRGLWRSEIGLGPDCPAGWYAWTLHELTPDGDLVVVPAVGGATSLGRGELYHDPEGRRDSDGDTLPGPANPAPFELTLTATARPIG